VKIGDRIVCLLADADAYPTVTGWSDETIGGVVYRNFTVSGDSPWWVDQSFVSFELGKTALVVASID
jgi:hypothetical protein